MKYPGTGIYQTLGMRVPFYVNPGSKNYIKTIDPKLTANDLVLNISGSGSVNGTPCIVGGKVFFGTGPSDYIPVEETPYMGIWCVDLNDRRILWNTTICYDNGTPAGSVSGLTVFEDRVYAGGIDGKLYCLDADDGHIIWNSPVIEPSGEYGLSSTPLVLKNESGSTNVYVTTKTAFLGYTAADGSASPSEIVNISLSGGVADFSSPSSDGSFIYSSGMNGVFAVSLQDYAVAWNSHETYGDTGTPVYSDGSVFFTTASGVYCLNAGNGREKWKDESRGGLATAPAVNDDLVISNSPAGLAAYGKTDGSLKWTHEPVTCLSGDILIISCEVSPNSPVISGDIVYYTSNIELIHNRLYGSHTSNVYGLDICTGKPHAGSSYKYDNGMYQEYGNPYDEYSFTINSSKICTSSPCISDGYFFVGTGSYPPVNDTYVEDVTALYQAAHDGQGSLMKKFKPYPYSDTYSDSLIIRGSGRADEETEINIIEGLTVVPHEKTVIGALSAFSDERNLSWAVADGQIKTFAGFSDNSRYRWNITLNGQPAGPEDPVSDGDVIVADYVDQDGKKYVGIKLTVNVMTYAEIQMTADRTVFASGDETGTATAAVTLYDGSSPDESCLSWETTGTVSADGTGLTVTFSPGSQGGTLKAVYAPEGAVPVTFEIPVKVASGISAPDVPVSTYTLWKGNEARTGYIRENGPKTLTTPRITDHRPNGTDTKSMPLVSGSPVTDGNGNIFYTIWTGGMAGNETANGLYSYTTDGQLNWRSDNVNSRTTATYFDGRIYVGHIAGAMLCLDAENGETLWSTPAISSYPYTGLTASPLVVKNDDGRKLVYILTYAQSNKDADNYLYVYEDAGSSCKELFRIPIGVSGTEKNGGTSMYSSVSMNADRSSLYVSGGGGVIAFDPETMVRQWAFDAGAQGPKNNVYVGTPVYYNNSVYVAVSGALYSLNAVTGLENWNVTNTQINPSTPAVTETQVIATGYCSKEDEIGSFGIAGYDLTDGHLLWHFDDGSASRASPVVAGDTVYYGTYKDQTLFAVDITKTDGGAADLRWSYLADEVAPGWWSLFEGTPLILDRTLYIGAENGYFYAFRDPMFTITATDTEYGTIDPSGETTVEEGGSVTFMITPDEGCHIKDVLVDNVSVGAVSEYSFSNVDSDHVISAVFGKGDAADTFTITASPSRNGVIRPAGDTVVEAGGSVVCTITPDSGWHIADVLVDGVSVGAVSSY
ncbi:PQQ-binding-like beta-propeller repeat protein, partial [Methanosarcinaceae archaeon]|nr:PQQ-binding-like beta-propeller repeat protein [Methanosarcinaceae archaeon]